MIFIGIGKVLKKSYSQNAHTNCIDPNLNIHITQKAQLVFSLSSQVKISFTRHNMQKQLNSKNQVKNVILFPLCTWMLD